MVTLPQGAGKLGLEASFNNSSGAREAAPSAARVAARRVTSWSCPGSL